MCVVRHEPYVSVYQHDLVCNYLRRREIHVYFLLRIINIIATCCSSKVAKKNLGKMKILRRRFVNKDAISLSTFYYFYYYYYFIIIFLYPIQSVFVRNCFHWSLKFAAFRSHLQINFTLLMYPFPMLSFISFLMTLSNS